MNDIIQNRADTWNKRLRVLITEKEYSQQSFAKDFNKKYGTKCTQKDVSRWVNVGMRKEEINPKTGEKETKIIGFPSYQNMICLADFFSVDVGFLTGETDYESFTAERTSNYLGLNQDSVKKIKLATSYSNTFAIKPILSKTAITAMDKLFTAEKFFSFLRSLHDLDCEYRRPNPAPKLWSDLEKKLGPELMAEGLNLIKSNYEDPDFPLPRNEVIQAMHLINEIWDNDYIESTIKEDSVDICRFRLQKAFTEMIDDMYPSK